MKFLRFAVAATFLLGFSSAYAFHSGGVAECGGCHAMHKANSVDTIVGASNANLLNNNNVSSTCLDCHSGPTLSSYHVLTFPLPAAGIPPANRTPGGDFAWLAKTYSYFVRGSPTIYSPGGHLIVAPEYGLNNAGGLSPGGSFPAAQLGCSSCHDPHSKARMNSLGAEVAVATNKIIGSGSYTTLATPATGETAISAYGLYRLLYTNNSYYSGVNYAGPVPATIQGGAVTFATAPLAVAPSTYNQSENTNQVVVRYGNYAGRTMGLWCASCHASMHTNSGLLVHPIDQAMSSGGVNGYYNVYRNSGNKAGAQATAYNSLVPFAMDSASRAALASAASNTNSALSQVGAGPADTVMCLSCHRAHASGFQGGIRWEYEGEFITHVNSTTFAAVWPGTDNGAPLQFARGKTSTETQAAMYDRPVSQFGGYQRSLCNKCHLQD